MSTKLFTQFTIEPMPRDDYEKNQPKFRIELGEYAKDFYALLDKVRKIGNNEEKIKTLFGNSGINEQEPKIVQHTSLIDTQISENITNAKEVQSPQIDYENLKEQIGDFIEKNSKFNTKQIEPLFLNLDDKLSLKVSFNGTWSEINQSQDKKNSFYFSVGETKYIKIRCCNPNFINRINVDIANINNVEDKLGNKYDDIDQAIDDTINKLKNYFTQGEKYENARYDKSNGEFERRDKRAGNEVLSPGFTQPKSLSNRQIISDEPENFRANSTEFLQSRAEPRKTFSEIGIGPNKANASEYSGQSTRNDDELQRADNDIAKTQGNLIATKENLDRKQKQEPSRTSQDKGEKGGNPSQTLSLREIVSEKERQELLAELDKLNDQEDEKCLNDIQNVIKLEQNSTELNQTDKDLTLEIGSKEFLKAFQNKALELSLMFLEPKELAQLQKTIKGVKAKPNFYEKLWENNINTKADRINYETKNLRSHDRDFFTHLFSQAVKSNTSSKIDLETTNFISRILIEKTQNLFFLSDEMEKSKQSLEKFIDKFENQTEHRKKRKWA